MRIVHVVNNLSGAGAQNLVVLLASSQARSHSVVVVTVDRPATEYEIALRERLQAAGVTCLCLGREVGSGIRGLHVIFALLAELKALRPDIVNSHLEFSHLLVGAVNALNFLRRKKWKSIMTVHSAPEVLPLVTKIITIGVPRVYCSDAAYEADDARPNRCCVIDNGVQPQSATIDRERKRREVMALIGAHCDAKLIMTAGAVRWEKNYQCAIEAVAYANIHKTDLPELHYLICGRKGAEFELAQSKVRECNAESFVHFLGMRGDVPELLVAADCYFSTSIKEGLPLSVLEAMFSGIPCVLSPIESHINIATGIPGCQLSENATPAALAGALLGTLSSIKQSHEQLIVARKSLLERYEINVCSDKYLGFYTKVLNK